MQKSVNSPRQSSQWILDAAGGYEGGRRKLTKLYIHNDKTRECLAAASFRYMSGGCVVRELSRSIRDPPPASEPNLR
jgi:hypothetical protein